MVKKYISASVVLSLGIYIAIVPTTTRASLIQMGFILDNSISINASEWKTIRQGLSDAIDQIPIGGTDTYEVSIVTFNSGATIQAQNILLNTSFARDRLSEEILNYQNSNGLTNYATAFTTMENVLDNNIINADYSYVSFATDGIPTRGKSLFPVTTHNQAGINARNSIIGVGVDKISVTGIGTNTWGAQNLRMNYCYPQPCDTSEPYNFPTQGFYYNAANAGGYADAVQKKTDDVTIRIIEPATMILLFLAFMVMLAVRAFKKAM